MQAKREDYVCVARMGGAAEGVVGLRGPRASGLCDVGQTNGPCKYKTEDFPPCPDGTLLYVEGKLGVRI